MNHAPPLLAALPWLNRLFGGDSAGQGEGIETTIVHTWPWPLWVTLLLLIGATIVVIAVYLRERIAAARGWRFVLIGLRIALIGLVVFMLYGWVRHRHRTDLPDAVVIIDDSASMSVIDHYDKSEQRAALEKRVRDAGFSELSRINLAKTLLLENDAELWQALEGRYNLKVYRIGESVRAEPGNADTRAAAIKAMAAEEPASRLGRGLREVLEAQRGRPTAAIILLSDGITTEGRSLSETADFARRKAIPLYTVAIGSNRAPRDLRLHDLLVDDVAFVGDLLNFDFKLTAGGYAGKQATVRLKREGTSAILAEKVVTISDDGQTVSDRLTLRPTEEGEFRYVLEAEPLAGEADASNNRQMATVRVQDEAIRVLLVQAYPNYEYRYLKNLLERELNSKKVDAAETEPAFRVVLQEADTKFEQFDKTALKDFPVKRDELFKYDVLIFGDVNPSFLSRSMMDNVRAFVEERGGGVIFIAGTRYTPLAYRDTPLAALFPVDLNTVTLPDVQQAIKQGFKPRPTPLGATSAALQLGDSPAESLRIWSEKLPPLYWMLEANDLKPGARVLAEHPTRTNTNGQNFPVIALQFVGAGKVVFHTTDETWRWRFRAGDVYLERYWIQTIRYLSRSKLLGNNRQVELVADPPSARRDEAVRLRVRFLDDRAAPAEDDGVTVMLEREEGQRKQMKLRRDAAARGVFEGTVSNLAEGRYRVWLAAPQVEGKPPATQFVVVEPPGERNRLEADLADMRAAAEKTQGRAYTFATADKLLDDLPEGRQVRIESMPPEAVWNYPLFAALFVVLLVAEWLTRKYVGLL
jgi:hypothetical protein